MRLVERMHLYHVGLLAAPLLLGCMQELGDVDEGLESMSEETELRTPRDGENGMCAELGCSGEDLDPTSAAVSRSAVQVNSTVFSVDYPGGETTGSLTWHNRSVEVQGSVSDFADPHSTIVYFDFWHHNVHLSFTNRTAGPRKRNHPFHFTEPGPSGGITRVWVTLCEGNIRCFDVEVHDRP